MNSKERVLTALRHVEPDRVPIYNSFTPEVAREFARMYAAEGYELDRALGHDCLLVELGIFNGFYLDFSKECYIDRWGIRWRRIEHRYGCYMEIAEPLLKNAEDVYNFRCPDVKGEPFYPDLVSVIKRYGEDRAIIGGSISLFENSWYLRGFQSFLSDLVLHKREVNELLEKVLQYNLELGLKIIDTGVDILYTGDDFGMQTGLIISYGMWREFFHPRWKLLFSEFKKRNPSLLIAYHSDGNILPLIDDLIEIGMDVLNPVQPQCMDPAQLKRRHGKNLSFWGTIDVQHTLSMGKPDDVEAEVLERLKSVAPGGGLLLGSSHNVQPSERAVENVQAFYRVVKEHGSYPIRRVK